MNKENTPFYSFKYDIVFKAIFGDERNLSYLESLIGECLKTKIKILKLIPTEQRSSKVKEKRKNLDLLIEAEGKKINVEIDTAYNNLNILRNMHYFYSFCCSNTVVGKKYDLETEFLHISFNYSMSLKEPYISEYKWRRKDNKELGIKHRYIIVNIAKYEKLWYDRNIKEIKKYKFLTLISIKDKNELKTYAKTIKQKNITKVVSKVFGMNEDGVFRYIVSPDEEAEIIENTYKDIIEKRIMRKAQKKEYKAYKRGRTEGKIKESEKTNKIVRFEIAQKLLKNNNDINFISKMTALPIKTIKKIKQELVMNSN